MARRQSQNATRGAGSEPAGHQRRVSREAARLTIALLLLCAAGLGSALTGVPLTAGEAGSGTHSGPRSRFFRGELTHFTLFQRPLPRASVAELERRDGAFRVLAGLPSDGAGSEVSAPAESPPAWSADAVAARAAYGKPADLRSVVRQARRVSFTWREAEDSVMEYRDRLLYTPSIVPASGYISSGFSRGRLHPILALRRPHRGLDIVAPFGSPIMASARGRVSFVGYEGEYGLMVEIDHGRGLMTRYAHASRALVKTGQLVGRGDTIARVGHSGLADGSHVHYEVLVNGEPRNPRRYIFSPNILPD